MKPLLEFRAGPAAFRQIREHGFHPDQVDMLVAASGGPKWIVLSALDRYLATTFFSSRKRPLRLVGSSSGAWRVACYARRDAGTALMHLEHLYIHQQYSARPGPSEIARGCHRLLDELVGTAGAAEVLDHPWARVSFTAVRGGALVASELRAVQLLGLTMAGLANMVDRRWMGLFLSRGLFYDARTPPARPGDMVPTHVVPLSTANLVPGLLASGSIPLLVRGVRNIPGAPAGVYRDGGVTDYHFDIPFTDRGRLVLYHHFCERIVPGWFDRFLPWRQPRPEATDRMLLVHPTQEFVAGLPQARIPDRHDFSRMDYRQRVECWSRVAERSQELAEEFHRVVHGGELPARLKPLPRSVLTNAAAGTIPASSAGSQAPALAVWQEDGRG